jgi:hypothetical protein
MPVSWQTTADIHMQWMLFPVYSKLRFKKYNSTRFKSSSDFMCLQVCDNISMSTEIAKKQRIMKTIKFNTMHSICEANGQPWGQE